MWKSACPGSTRCPTRTSVNRTLPASGLRTGIHEAVLADHPDLSDYQIYVSGPPVMVDAARASFVQAGARLDRIFSDSFDYAYVTGHDAVA